MERRERVIINDSDRAWLEGLAKEDTQRGLRARIILGCEHASDPEVARLLRVSRATVQKWRGRFQENCRSQWGCSLTDRRRSGAPRALDPKLVQAVIITTCDTRAPDGRLWTTRSLAAHLGTTQGAVHRIWSYYDIRPRPSRRQRRMFEFDGFVYPVGWWRRSKEPPEWYGAPPRNPAKRRKTRNLDPAVRRRRREKWKYG